MYTVQKMEGPILISKNLVRLTLVDVDAAADDFDASV
jgi:hypothetical protein